MNRTENIEIPKEPEWRAENYKDIIRDKRDFVENLPLPHVRYPDVYGTWLSFRSTFDAQPWFCSCQKPAMINFLRMNEVTTHYRLRPGDSLLSHFLDSSSVEFFTPIHSIDDLRRENCFKDSICHRCNLKVPSVRWSNHPSHSVFMQHFGWYVKQSHLSFGINWLSPFLRDQCPKDLLDLLVPDPWEMQAKLNACAQKHGYRIFPMARLPLEFRADPDEERDTRSTLHSLERVKREVEVEIENRLRGHLGFPRMGDTRNHETLLFLIAKGIFPDSDIIRNARPKFLNGLTLDVYIPHLSLAFEYQGIQHFRPLRHLGGDKQFLEVRKRDKRKLELCRTEGIRLIYFDQSDKMTESHIQKRISQQDAPSNGG